MVNKLALSPLSLQFRQVVFFLCQTTPFLTVWRLMPLTLRLELCSHRILMVYATPSLSSLSHSQIWSGTTPCMTRSFLQLSLPSNSGLGTFWMWFPPLMLMTGYGFKDKTNTKPQPNKYKGVPESSHLTSRGRAKTRYGAETENVVRSRLRSVRSVRRGYEMFARLRKGFDGTERSSETKTGL